MCAWLCSIVSAAPQSSFLSQPTAPNRCSFVFSATVCKMWRACNRARVFASWQKKKLRTFRFSTENVFFRQFFLVHWIYLAESDYQANSEQMFFFLVLKCQEANTRAQYCRKYHVKLRKIDVFYFLILQNYKIRTDFCVFECESDKKGARGICRVILLIHGEAF